MDPIREMEDKLLEAASIGDEQTIQLLLAKGVDVNTQHRMNGWSALHWASKRGFIGIVSTLLQKGAKKDVQTDKGLIAVDVTNDSRVKELLGGNPDDITNSGDNLPITPNYISHPPFPYVSEVKQPPFEKLPTTPVNNLQHMTLANSEVSNQKFNCITNTMNAHEDDIELVVKARIANAAEKDFIEIELLKSHLSFENLISTMSRELQVDRKLVQKIRKMPDTIVRKDKDVKRLRDFQELELVLTNRAISESSRNYGDTPSPKPVNIVY